MSGSGGLPVNKRIVYVLCTYHPPPLPPIPLYPLFRALWEITNVFDTGAVHFPEGGELDIVSLHTF